jgi:lipoate-protein ligase A
MTDYPPSTWRLIRSPAGNGPMLMGVDEAIHHAVAQGTVRPTLRLYAWDPPCLSLGRNQPVAEVDRGGLRGAGYDLVRRPTGGRAILHTDELTYSVAVPLIDPRVGGGVLASCERLSQGLNRALEILGVEDATAHRREGRPSTPEPVCFQAAGAFEIVFGGRKLIGSAQMRRRGALLQHGTLPLRGDIARISAFLVPPADPDRVRHRATTLEVAAGRAISWQEAAEAVAEGFAQALNVRPEPGELTTEERSTAAKLARDTYRSAEWTERK